MIEESASHAAGEQPPADNDERIKQSRPASAGSAGIDLATEQLIPFNQVPSLLPRVRRGRKPHVGSIFRWAKKGLAGHRLEYLQVGGVKCTSVEALQRFFERISSPDRPVAPRSFAKRQREIKRATAEVQRLLYGNS